MSYSQNDEEDVILRYFGDRKGRFLDIGAHDGIYYSNTRALLERGWGGVMIEPDPRSMAKLINNTLPFADRLMLISAAVSNVDRNVGSRLWLDSAPDMEWASGITNKPPKPIREPAKTILIVPTIHAPSLIPTYFPFNFISIDAEGMDLDIIKGFGVPLPCELLCAEPYFEAGRKEMIEYLETQCNFSVFHQTKDNIIAARNP